MNHAPMLEALRERLERGGCPVQFMGWLNDREREERGQLIPPQLSDGADGPAIHVFREDVRVPGDPLFELLTLAHEAGHLESWRTGERSPACSTALNTLGERGPDALSAAEQAVVFEEEVRAWRNAEIILGQLGFGAWGAFEAQREKALSSYRRGLTKLPG